MLLAYDAKIHINKDELTSAITIHLSAAVLGLHSATTGHDPERNQLPIVVNGTMKEFSILHLITDYTGMIGVILQGVEFNRDADNTVNYIAVKFSPKFDEQPRQIHKVSGGAGAYDPDEAFRELVSLLVSP